MKGVKIFVQPILTVGVMTDSEEELYWLLQQHTMGGCCVRIY